MSDSNLNTDDGSKLLASLSAAACSRHRIIPADRETLPHGAAMHGAAIEAIDMVPEAVVFLKPDLRIADANAAAARIWGYRRGEMRGMPLDALISIRSLGRLRAAVGRLTRGAATNENLRTRRQRNDGGSLAVEIQLRAVLHPEEPLVVAVFHEAGQRLRPAADASSRDYLTGLPARPALEARLRGVERRGRRRSSRVAVLFIDLDGFKCVNDTAGHGGGDVVLRTIGRRLKACLRPVDFVARYGGDEFVVLIENVCDDAEVEEIARRIGAELAAPVQLFGRRLSISASIGVAIGQAPASARALVGEADLAMYRAKRAQGAAR